MSYEYKTIPAPTTLKVKNDRDAEAAIRGYGRLITQESTDGWEYHSMSSIVVDQPEGCFLFGKRINVYYNMLVFRRALPAQ